MLTYKAAYYDASGGWIAGEVLDFPGAVSQGQGLDDARRMLASALVDIAETLLLDGTPLPKPDPTADRPDAELVEPIYLLLDAASSVRIIPERAGA